MPPRKSVIKTILYKDFPIGLVSPAMKRDELPFRKFVKLPDILNDLMHVFLDERFADPDRSGFHTTVREYLIRNWYEMNDYSPVKIPKYLYDIAPKAQTVKTAFACLYTDYATDIHRANASEELTDIYKIPQTPRAMFQQMPYLFRPFVREMKNSDQDDLISRLREAPGLDRFMDFLDHAKPEHFDPDKFNDSRALRTEFRRELFELVVRHAAVEATADIVTKYFNRFGVEEGKFNHREVYADSPEALVESLKLLIRRTLAKPMKDAPKTIPFMATEGAVYTLIYPLPKCLVIPRFGTANYVHFTKSRSESLKDFVGQRVVDLELSHRLMDSNRSVTDIPSFTEDAYVSAFSSSPAVLNVPRSLLVPDFNSERCEYTFGCQSGCSDWQRRSHTMFYWHPFYRMWTEYATAGRGDSIEYLKENVQPNFKVKFKPVSFCPWCGAPLGEGKPYLVRGNLPTSRRAYNFEEDYVEIKGPYLKYHVDLWDRILQYYFKLEYVGREKLDILDNYVFMSDTEVRTDSADIRLGVTGEDLWVNDLRFTKQDLVFMSFVLYQTRKTWEGAMLESGGVTEFGGEEVV